MDNQTGEQWRSWVRFVLADAPSPPPDISCAELQELVARQWDALEQKLEDAREALEHLRQIHESGDCGQMLSRVLSEFDAALAQR